MPKKALASKPAQIRLTPVETAQYTGEMLESLRKISLEQGQTLLAHFLELAAFEARSWAATQAQETRLPE
jgi:hypothetical protein